MPNQASFPDPARYDNDLDLAFEVGIVMALDCVSQDVRRSVRRKRPLQAKEILRLLARQRRRIANEPVYKTAQRLGIKGPAFGLFGGRR